MAYNFLVKPTTVNPSLPITTRIQRPIVGVIVSSVKSIGSGIFGKPKPRPVRYPYMQKGSLG